jgi:DNA topoisomerase-1
MANALYDTLTVNIDGNSYDFRANGQTLKFKGFMAVYVEDEDETNSKDKEEFTKIPPLNENEEIRKEELKSKQSFTEPPPRYTEASLVKALE